MKKGNYIERVGKLVGNFDDAINNANQDLTQENANTDGSSPTGIMGIFASESAKFYAEDLLDEEVKREFEDGYIHIHDFDYYATGTTTCCQLPLETILKDGFTVGNCYMREPKDILSAGALASIAIQSNQNNQHGGQSYNNFDYDLAPYVEKTYNKHLKDLGKLRVSPDAIREIAMSKTVEDTFQSMEAFVHNANSMLCRNGQQVPFISINLGTDTSKWGRIVSEQLMLAVQKGLGDGATPIFPIVVFKVKEGINFNPGDVNHDLYKLALETTSKRLFPNFVFMDSPFNLQYYKEGDKHSEIATINKLVA